MVEFESAPIFAHVKKKSIDTTPVGLEGCRKEVGSEKVLLGLSGGVDSAVVATLLQRAIGDQVTCIFVDNGLLRLGEGEEVMNTFREHFGVEVRRVEAEQRFLTQLVGITDPEEKRKIIGRVFIEVFQEEAKKVDGATWLAQGTIYPDIIESAGIEGSQEDCTKTETGTGSGDRCIPVNHVIGTQTWKGFHCQSLSALHCPRCLYLSKPG